MKTGALLRAAAGPAAGGSFDIGTPDVHWTFDDIANLWKDTGLTSAVTADGDIIKGVTDLAAGAQPLTEATNGPTYKVAIQNGLSVARFDGTNDQLKNTTAGNAQPNTLIVAAKFNADVDGILIGETSLASYFKVDTTGPKYNLVLGGGAHTLDSIAADLTWHVFTILLTTNSCTVRVDGVEQLVAAAAAGTWNGIMLGSMSGVGFYASVDVGEVAVYWSTITDPDLSTYETSLMSKWI